MRWWTKIWIFWLALHIRFSIGARLVGPLCEPYRYNASVLKEGGWEHLVITWYLKIWSTCETPYEFTLCQKNGGCSLCKISLLHIVRRRTVHCSLIKIVFLDSILFLEQFGFQKSFWKGPFWLHSASLGRLYRI